MDFLKKIQRLDLFYRKFIFWFIIVSLTIGLGVLFLKNSKKRLENLKTDSFLENFNIQNFKQELKTPWSEQLGEEMKKIEEIIKEMEENSVSTSSQQ
jgi:hypothetical protein